MIECRLNDEVIFTYKDFTDPVEHVENPMPILEAGKSWIMREYHNDLIGNGSKNSYDRFYRVECVDDRSVFLDPDCWSLRKTYIGCEEDTIWFKAWQYGGTVLRSRYGGNKILDINAKPGDKFDVENSTTNSQIEIVSERVNNARGVARRELTCNAGPELSWVEGIGAQSDYAWLMESGNMAVITPYEIYGTDLYACYKDGEEIFSYKDFNKPLADTDFHPLLEPGKEWIVKEYTKNVVGGEDITHIATVKVAGDTVVRGRDCKVLVKEYADGHAAPTRMALYEEYGVLYYDDYDKRFSRVLNFNLGASHVVNVYEVGYEQMYVRKLGVTNVKEVEVNGQTVRELTLEREYPGGVAGCWVEGVGSSTSEAWLRTEPPMDCGYNNTVTTLLECKLNGKTIFRAEDFSSIREVEATGLKGGEDKIYDLHGRRVYAPAKNGIYIVNGRATKL